MEAWIIVIIILVIILILGCGICYYIIRKKSKKEEKIDGGVSVVRCPNMNFNTSGYYEFQKCAFREKEKVISVLLDFLNNYEFINVVTVCPPHEFITVDLKPVIFVDPMGLDATADFNPVKKGYCQFAIKSEDLFNYVNGNEELKRKINRKVKVFHIDFGMSGALYLNRNHLEEINNRWMTEDGIFSSNNCNFRKLFNITQQYFTAYVANKNEEVQCLFDIFDAYIPDYQKLEDNPFVFADKYIKGSPIMTEANKYYDYLDYVIYNAENHVDASMKTQFLRAWSLNEKAYNEILNVRKNLNNAESVCAQLCYMLYLSPIIYYTSSMSEYLKPSSETYESFKSENPPSEIKDLLNNENLNEEVQEEINKIIEYFKLIGIEIKISADIYKLLLMFFYCKNDVILNDEYLKFIDNCDDYMQAMDIPEEGGLWDITKSAIKFILSNKTLDDITNFVQSLNDHQFRGKYFPDLIRSLISKTKKPNEIDDEVISKLKACIELFDINADEYLYSVFGITMNENGNRTIIENFADFVQYSPRAIKQFIMVPKNRVMI